MKNILIVFILSLTVFFNNCNSGKKQTKNNPGEKMNNSSANKPGGDFILTIEKNTLKVNAEKYPLIQIKLTNNKNTGIKLKWDKNFGNLLWESQFLLIIEQNESKTDSSELRFRTSNTYSAEKEIELKNKESIKSTLDFNSLPASYTSFSLKKPGKVKISIINKTLNLKSNTLELLIK